MRVLRDWLVWLATWVVVVEAPMAAAVALDAWRERTEPTLDALPVPGWVPAACYVAGVLVPVAAILLLLSSRRPALRRPGLVMRAAGLAVSAVVFSGFPGETVGPLYVALTALAAGAALTGALLPGGSPGAAPPLRGPGLALAAAGAFACWTCWRGASYWQWDGWSAGTYEVGLVLSAALVVLGLTARRWGGLRSRSLRWVLTATGVVGGVYAVVAVLLLREYAVLYRWEEVEPAWGLVTPMLLGGTGLVAAATAARTRRGDLVAWSLASATTFALLALWRESTWGSVMS